VRSDDRQESTLGRQFLASYRSFVSDVWSIGLTAGQDYLREKSGFEKELADLGLRDVQVHLDSEAVVNLVCTPDKHCVWFHPSPFVDPQATRYFSPVRFPECLVRKAMDRVAEGGGNRPVPENRIGLLSECGLQFSAPVMQVRVFVNGPTGRHLVVPRLPHGVSVNDVRRLVNANDWMYFASGLNQL